MSTSPKLSPPVIGQAEHAHRAILDRILTRTGTTFEQWIALNLGAASARVERSVLVSRLAGALKIDENAALGTIEQLTSADLVRLQAEDPVSIGITESGELRYRSIRREVDAVIARLYDDIPADDLKTAGRVLTLVTARANGELERMSEDLLAHATG